MNNNHTKTAQRHVTAGWLFIAASLLLLFAGGLNIFDSLRAGRTPDPLPLISLALGVVALGLGTILLIDGWTVRWQTEKGNGRETQPPDASRMNASSPEKDTAPAAAAPGSDRASSAGRGTIPGRGSLEAPATKKCPACAKDVYKDARVCRYCGRAFSVTLRLKVYPPEDEAKRNEVIRILAAKLRMPADEVAHLLELGMRFKYDSPGKLAASRGKFEAMGCKTEEYEKAGRE
jgi:hypothetical protein